MDSAFKYRDFSEVEMTNVGLLTEIASYGHLSLAALRQAQDKLCRSPARAGLLPRSGCEQISTAAVAGQAGSI